MLIFQCENPSTLNGVTMTDCVTAFLHKVIIFLILNSSRLCSKPSQIVAYLLPTCIRLPLVKRTFSNVLLIFIFLLAKIEEV